MDYKNVDWKELHKRAPETHPDDNPPILKYSEVVPKLRENGYVKQEKIKIIDKGANQNE